MIIRTGYFLYTLRLSSRAIYFHLLCRLVRHLQTPRYSRFIHSTVHVLPIHTLKFKPNSVVVCVILFNPPFSCRCDPNLLHSPKIQQASTKQQQHILAKSVEAAEPFAASYWVCLLSITSLLKDELPIVNPPESNPDALLLSLCSGSESIPSSHREFTCSLWV